MQAKRTVPLDKLYAVAIVTVLAEHPQGLTEAQLEAKATDWLRAAKHTLVTELEQAA
jgi:hypothetical protein